MSENTKTWTNVTGAIRPPFLILTPACILLAVGVCVAAGFSINSQVLTLITIAAISAHISVNAFNEYFDFKSGLDDQTIRTPFSGGSGTLQTYPDQASQVLSIAIGSSLLSSLIGIYFAISIGWQILPLGLIGMLLIVFYTTHITRMPLLCLIAPGLAFGPLMVIGIAFLLSGQFLTSAVWASLIPFFLVSNLLLLNQFPDIEADKTVGRDHLPIRIGKQASSWIFATFTLLAYIALALGVMFGGLHQWALIGLLTAPLALLAITGAIKNAEQTEQLLQPMKLNVMINIVTPSLIGLGLILG